MGPQENSFTTANHMSRRTMLSWAGSAGMLAVGGVVLNACASPTLPPGTQPAGLVLRPGFTARIIAKGGESLAGIDYRIFPDGATTFVDSATPGGWYYCVNHEIPLNGGGATSIRFAPDGSIRSAYQILTGTSSNCAGGGTPWGTWLSCEEFDGGQVWECDPTGSSQPKLRPAMGTFSHEAATVAADGRLYLTEDKPDGGFYRFTPDRPEDLSSGLLEIACGAAAPGPVTWERVPDPSATTGTTRTQVAGSLKFAGGEGIDSLGNKLWFTTKGDNRLWEYRTDSATVDIRYQGGGSSTLSGVDNVWVDNPSGNIFVAEDGGNMELVMIRPDNSAEAIVRINDQDGSEITGPCFSPDGQRLYFSSQRGPATITNAPFGITYEVTGPFDELLGRP